MLDDTAFRHIAPSEPEPDTRGANLRWRNKRPPFECIALLLQGGGALGSYQAGVYEALAEADLHPDWVAGISIGAINAAIIAGNPPAERIGKLRSFWEQITTNPLLDWGLAAADFGLKGELARTMFGQMSAGIDDDQRRVRILLPAPACLPGCSRRGALEATSFYKTELLKSTLEQLVDFDRINEGEMRFSVGAVNVRSGNFVYFDNTTHKIRPEHVMASGALPQAFRPSRLKANIIGTAV